MPTQHGVPQGSKLGPILYIIYANDLLKTLENSKNFAYADDTAIVVAETNLTTAIDQMQNQLNIATKWCHDNGLIINANKTKVMHIKPPHLSNSQVTLVYHNTNCLHYQIKNSNLCDGNCNTNIEIVNIYKYLGVYVDSSFKWKFQIDDLKKKLRKTAYTLFHLSYCANYNVLRQAYFSLAESYLRHGVTAWGSAKYSKSLQKSQNAIVKILWKNYHATTSYGISTNNNSNYRAIFKELNILNVKSIYSTTIVNEFFGDNRFLRIINHPYQTRRRVQNRYQTDRFLNEFGRSTLGVTLPSILNNLPNEILNVKNNFKRKKLIKNFFINSQ
ncbi:uncharacterized protein ACRADG_006262 [Cochliomyia hominivorax]